jgi:superfamily II DNA/RNA helicase
VFVHLKTHADALSAFLQTRGVSCAAVHSDLTLAQRNAALVDLRGKKLRALVATNVLARGIDLPGLSHVINFDVPHSAEDYVHRVGRTVEA